MYLFQRLMEFLGTWIFEGRFPREELHVRRWIAALGLLVIIPLIVALIAVGLD